MAGAWGGQPPLPQHPADGHGDFGHGSADFGNMGSMGGGGQDANFQAMESIAKAGFGVYGEKLYGKGQSFVHKYLPGKATLYPYLNVNNRYVMGKLRMVLCPFLFKGDWNRTASQVSGGRLFNPPKYDVHAPDLYIPLMGLFTYVLLSCLAMVLGDRFRPDHLRSQAYTGALAWAFACVALWGGMKAVGQAGQPWLDLAAYSGYLFVAVALQTAVGLVSRHLWYAAWLWTAAAHAYFLVKTVKRIVAANRQGTPRGDATVTNYVLLALGMLQFPLSYWIGVLP